VGGLGVTVAIPVLNGMAHLPDVLDALRRQECVGELEILVFDSTSDDGSWEWLSARSDIVTRQIPRHGFSHGRTRQQMVEQASHGYVAFLTQDAVPASRLWLAELIRPFGLSDQVAAVVGLQTPRPDAPAVVKRDIVVSFANLGNPLGISIYQNGPTVDAVYGRQPLAFISDVNAAYRRDILMGPVPFPPVDYAEDQAIARELLDAGYAIAYSPFAEVIHSNDLDLGNFKERIVDETAGLHEWLGVEPPEERVAGRGLVKASAKGIRFALQEPNRPFRARVRAAVAVPAFELRRRQAWRITRGARG
jgi:rhamnosyltransferase